MADSLGADELVGELLNITRLPAQEHYFKAGVVIEMSMQSRDNNLVMFMLEVGEFFRKQASVMIIDQGHGSDDGGFRGYDRSPYNPVPDEIAERFRPVVVPFVSDEFVKTIE